MEDLRARAPAAAHVLLVVLGAASLAGCRTAARDPYASTAEGVAEHYADVLRPGARREAVVARLGPPRWSWDDAALATWYVFAWRDGDGLHVGEGVAGYPDVPFDARRYCLVLAFDGGGRVQEHRFVRVNRW